MREIAAYTQINDTECMKRLIDENASLVFAIAKKIKRKLPSFIDLDDLTQSGFVGLVEATKSFNQEGGASFETFAAIRIKGAMLDFLRKNSWGNRETIKQIKLMGEAIHRVEQRKKSKATSAEIANEMNLSVEEYDRLCQQINVSNVTDLGDVEVLVSDNSMSSPEELSERHDLKDHIKKILQTLPEREQILLSLYYMEELTFKEISEVLDVTEARVSQLHAYCLAKIKKRLS